MDYILIIAPIAILGLLFLILNGIISSCVFNYKKRAFINLVFGLVFLVGFIIMYVLDKKYEPLYKPIVYFLFMLTTVFYTSVLFISLFIKGKRNRQKLFGRVKTILDKKEYLYLVCKYEDDIYLEKEKHHGFVIKLGSKDFHDDKIITFFRKYSLNITDENFIKIGEYCLKPKKGKDILYHCYLVKLPESLNILDYSPFNKREIINLDFDSLDKQIIFRILLQENFKIEREI